MVTNDPSAKARVRLGSVGQHPDTRIEVLVGNRWVDITDHCSAARVESSAGGVTSVTLTLIPGALEMIEDAHVLSVLEAAVDPALKPGDPLDVTPLRSRWRRWRKA